MNPEELTNQELKELILKSILNTESNSYAKLALNEMFHRLQHIELEADLIKITQHGQVKYIACDNKTGDNILNTSSNYTYINDPSIQFDADFIGSVQIDYRS